MADLMQADDKLHLPSYKNCSQDTITNFLYFVTDSDCMG